MAVYEIHLKCQTIKFHKVTLENNPRNRIPYAIIFTLRISGLPQKSIRENDTFARAKARQFAKSAKNIASPSRNFRFADAAPSADPAKSCGAAS